MDLGVRSCVTEVPGGGGGGNKREMMRKIQSSMAVLSGADGLRYAFLVGMARLDKKNIQTVYRY